MTLCNEELFINEFRKKRSEKYNKRCNRCVDKYKCPHGKIKRNCKECSPETSVTTTGLILNVIDEKRQCTSYKKKLSPDNFRTKRNGEYNKQCNRCLDSSRCEHNKERNKCKDCNGSGICVHHVRNGKVFLFVYMGKLEIVEEVHIANMIN